MGEYNLLIVDDNLRLCNAIAERFLQEGRFSVDICSSGTEALDFLKKNEADVALVDMLMPGMDGAEFMMQCREQKLGENTKFIALSSLRTFLADQRGGRQIDAITRHGIFYCNAYAPRKDMQNGRAAARYIAAGFCKRSTEKAGEAPRF